MRLSGGIAEDQRRHRLTNPGATILPFILLLNSQLPFVGTTGGAMSAKISSEINFFWLKRSKNFAPNRVSPARTSYNRKVKLNNGKHKIHGSYPTGYLSGDIGAGENTELILRS